MALHVVQCFVVLSVLLRLLQEQREQTYGYQEQKEDWDEFQHGHWHIYTAVVVQSPSHVQHFATPWTAASQLSLCLTIYQSLPKFMSKFTGDAIQPSHPLMPSFPSAPNLSQHQRLFQWVSCFHQMTKILELQLQHHSFKQVFRADFPSDWLAWLLCCPGDFQESSPVPQFEGINFLPSAFFTVQLSKLYMNTGKTIALTIRNFVSRVMSLLFKTLSKFVIAFLPRRNHLLISWLQSPQWFWSPKKEICHYFHLFPFYLPWHNGAGCHDLIFLIFSFKLALSLSSLTLIKRLFSSSSISAMRVVSSAYMRLLLVSPPVLIPASNSSSPAFLMMCSAYRLNKQGDNKQPCHTPFSILNQSVVPYKVLSVASWPIDRFLRKQVRWSGSPISLRAFTVCYDPQDQLNIQKWSSWHLVQSRHGK